MFNFIVVDDMEFYREQVKEAISHFSINTDVPTQDYIFPEYNRDFAKVSNSKLENKIYILDIETPKHNGIDVARKIRSKDEDCTIIFLTSYEDDYYPTLLRCNLRYNFVSKSEVFKIILINYFNIIMENTYSSKYHLTFKDYSNFISIKLKDILYVHSSDNKNIIETFNTKIAVNKSLDFLLKKLPNYFIRSHRACIINLKNVVLIGNDIIFSNGVKINLLSRKYKDEVINTFKMQQENSKQLL